MNNVNYNMMNYLEEDINRFWSKVNVIYKDDGTPDFDVCWEWKAGCFGEKKYGSFWFNGKTYCAHRFIYECFNGLIPDDLLVCHKCDNPSCVNPYHLFLGTFQDNMDDKVNKNRQAKGENAGKFNLTNNDVYDILLDIKNDIYIYPYQISNKYHIVVGVIYDILNNKIWKHITSKFCRENNIKLIYLKNKIIKKKQECLNYSNINLTKNQVKQLLNDIYNNKFICIKEICKYYNCKYENIRRILNNEYWKDVTSKFCKENKIELIDLKKKIIRDNQKGSNHPRSKLNEQIVICIKVKLKQGKTQKQLAKEYNVDPSTISSIKHNRFWKHVII